MPRRARISEGQILDAAQAIADERGLENLTLHGLAAALGVKPPSLYNHVQGLDAVHEGLHLRGLEHMTRLIDAATNDQTGLDALVAAAEAIRSFARAHPGLYAAAQPTVSPPTTSADLRAAGAKLLELLLGVVAEFGLSNEDAVHAVRAIRSATHGFIRLEQSNAWGMPADADESYALLIWTLGQGFTVLATE